MSHKFNVVKKQNIVKVTCSLFSSAFIDYMFIDIIDVTVITFDKTTYLQFHCCSDKTHQLMDYFFTEDVQKSFKSMKKLHF